MSAIGQLPREHITLLVMTLHFTNLQVVSLGAFLEVHHSSHPLAVPSLFLAVPPFSLAVPSLSTDTPFQTD